MRKGFGAIVFGIFVLSVLIQSCVAPKSSHVIDENEEVAMTKSDSLEQARLVRVDSVAQIRNTSNAPSNTFSNPPKVVKKRKL